MILLLQSLLSSSGSKRSRLFYVSPVSVRHGRFSTVFRDALESNLLSFLTVLCDQRMDRRKKRTTITFMGISTLCANFESEAQEDEEETAPSDAWAVYEKILEILGERITMCRQNRQERRWLEGWTSFRSSSTFHCRQNVFWAEVKVTTASKWINSDPIRSFPTPKLLDFVPIWHTSESNSRRFPACVNLFRCLFHSVFPAVVHIKMSQILCIFSLFPPNLPYPFPISFGT